jgi:pyrimidine oxygenase
LDFERGNVRPNRIPDRAQVSITMDTPVGSYETVCRLLDKSATVQGCEDVLPTFDDFIKGTEDFGARIQKPMTSRGHLEAA